MYDELLSLNKSQMGPLKSITGIFTDSGPEISSISLICFVLFFIPLVDFKVDVPTSFFN